MSHRAIFNGGAAATARWQRTSPGRRAPVSVNLVSSMTRAMRLAVRQLSRAGCSKRLRSTDPTDRPGRAEYRRAPFRPTRARTPARRGLRESSGARTESTRASPEARSLVVCSYAYRRRPFQKSRSAAARHKGARATERGLPLVLAAAQALQLSLKAAPLPQMGRWQLASLSPVHRFSIIFRVVQCDWHRCRKLESHTSAKRGKLYSIRPAWRRRATSLPHKLSA